jgi:hypothetical protein
MKLSGREQNTTHTRTQRREAKHEMMKSLAEDSLRWSVKLMEYNKRE